MISKETQDKQDSNNYNLIAITAVTTTALLTGGTYLICNIKPQFCPSMLKAQSNTLSLTVSSTVNGALIGLNNVVITGLQKSLSKEELVAMTINEVTKTVIDLFPDEISIRQRAESISSQSDDDLTLIKQRSDSISIESDDDLRALTRQNGESIFVESDDDVTSTKEPKRIDSIDEALGINNEDLVESGSNSASNSPLPRPNTPIFEGVNELSEDSTADLTGNILLTEDLI